MAFEFLGYQFDGAYQSPDSLEAKAGVYVVWSRCDEEWTVLDVGESEDVRSRIKNHDRKDCWEEHSPCEIYYSAVYTIEPQKTARTEIEQRIRRLAKPPCGDY